tara:strand:- start:27101 stop:27565 length:465 start_codon:yes stop_codon:yes gene_type:complete
MSVRDDFFDTAISRDFFGMICGDLLGQGLGREVYACAIEPTVVIKFETRARSFQNVLESECWDQVCHTALAKWFAPVINISACGTVLLMRRTMAPRPGELPDKVPSLFTDMKTENWGMLDGRPVCHDYGVTISNFSMKKTRKAIWTEQEAPARA